MKMKYPRIIVAGLKGGSGQDNPFAWADSSVQEEGNESYPFQKGPDYIDGGGFSTAAGTPGYNL